MKRILASALVFLVMGAGLVLTASCACAHMSDLEVPSFQSGCCAQEDSCHSHVDQTACLSLDLVHVDMPVGATTVSRDLNLTQKEEPFFSSSVESSSPTDSSGTVSSKEKTYLQISRLLI